MRQRKKARRIYKACGLYMDEVEKYGGIPGFETGISAATWKERILQKYVNKYFHVRFDQCAYGCVHPKSKKPVQRIPGRASLAVP